MDRFFKNPDDTTEDSMNAQRERQARRDKRRFLLALYIVGLALALFFLVLAFTKPARPGDALGEGGLTLVGHTEGHQAFHVGKKGSASDTIFCETFDEALEIVMAGKNGDIRAAAAAFGKYARTPSVSFPQQGVCIFFKAPALVSFTPLEDAGFFGETPVWGEPMLTWILKVLSGGNEWFMLSWWPLEAAHESGSEI